MKTRLAAALGAERACELYRAVAEEVVRRTAPAADYVRLLLFAPADAGLEMEAWLPGQRWAAQAEGDLGARMDAALAAAFAEGARRALLIGSDAPWLDRAAVRAAFDALDRHDVVIGPALDGGYYLIGLGAPRPELFRGIAWSTPAVLEATRARARDHGLSLALLPALRDLDTLDDVRAEWHRLAPLLAGRPELARALEAAL